ncbi:hypothetical protein [Microcystis phage Mwe-Yong1]|nr:hypothetical protein [Microcystis phage Mwe-Yong1]
MASEPLLDLATLIEGRPPIRIDGVTYHLKSPEELSLLESQRFTSWGKKLEALGATASADADAAAALDALVAEVAWAAVADVPREVFDKLSGSQLMSIVEVFTLLLLGRLRLAGALVEQVAKHRTGVSFSRASSSPMAAPPSDGSQPSQRLS